LAARQHSGNKSVVPLGTQIVTRTDLSQSDPNILKMNGVVGVVIKEPTGRSRKYRIRFPDGEVALLEREDFDVRKELAKALISERKIPANDFFEYVIFRCVVGSRAYGLEEPSSDVDRRGIFLPPADLQWSLFGVPEQLERHDTQECYWELEKFLRLALRANPNILECLYTPIVEEATPLANELLAMRDSFLTKQVYQTYNGYVLSQFKKLGQDLRNKGEIRWKHAMHLIRLLLSGIEILREGVVPVQVHEHRELLLSIRRGELTWAKIEKLRNQLHREFDSCWKNTKLPDGPNIRMVNAFLLKARRQMVQIES